MLHDGSITHTDLKLPAEVCEELYPELPIVHVVQPHLLLGVLTDQVPVLVSVPPVASPLVLVAPGVPHPDQAHPVLLAASRGVDPVETRDCVGVTLRLAGWSFRELIYFYIEAIEAGDGEK